jgi:L-fuculokinase
MSNVIAIFDVGKTNKKLFLFDEQYRIVWEQTEAFAETTDEDGDACEDLNQLNTWLLEALKTVLALPQFSVQAVNFSGYGASFVYVDKHGKPLGHLYNYLKPFPASLLQQFYAQYGPADALSVQTASPALESLNSGLQLYRMKHQQPDLWAQVAFALHLPQYLSYLISDWPIAEITSIGCHTTLWDFQKEDYHDWVKAEEINERLSYLVSSDLVVSENFGGHELLVGTGLHDSSAALIPYLASFGNDNQSLEKQSFILISTGTWCISMNPFNSQPLTAEELQYDCLCYLTYQGQPVKASRLFAGYEHEAQTRRLAAHFGVATDYYKQVQYDAKIIENLKQQHRVSHSETASETSLIPPVIMPSLAQSAFGARDLAQFTNYEVAYHQFMLDLMAQQVISTALVLHNSPVTRIFVDGGFGHNSLYMNLLADAFPEIEVWAASVAQASALGAALAIHTAWNPLPLPDDLITLAFYHPQPPPKTGGGFSKA